MRLRSKLPSAATVIAGVALFVALGTGVYAASTLPRESVGTRELKDDAVVSGKVENRTLRAPDFAPGGPVYTDAIALNGPSETLPNEMIEVISLEDRSEPIVPVVRSRFLVNGNVLLKNVGTEAAVIAACELASRPEWAPIGNAFSFQSGQSIPPGGYATVPVTGAFAAQPQDFAWDIAIRCKNTEPQSDDLEWSAAHMNVMVARVK